MTTTTLEFGIGVCESEKAPPETSFHVESWPEIGGLAALKDKSQISRGRTAHNVSRVSTKSPSSAARAPRVFYARAESEVSDIYFRRLTDLVRSDD